MGSDIRRTYDELAKRAGAEYSASRPANATVIQAGSATCEHAAGALDAAGEFRRLIAASGRDDIILRMTGCTGRCSCEPIVGVFAPGRIPVKYEHVDRDKAHRIFTEHVLGGTPAWDLVLDTPKGAPIQNVMMFCDGVRCGRIDRLDVRTNLERMLHDAGPAGETVQLVPADCFGLCPADHRGSAANVLVQPGNILYRVETESDLQEIVSDHIVGGRIVTRLRTSDEPIGRRFFDLYGDIAFFNRQSRIALRNAGVIDPENLFEYIRYRGFEALASALDTGDPERVVRDITDSKLRGRGGGGFPTGAKWSMVRATPSDVRYLICNADEGDPGAFMDRSMLESDPFGIIEGMVIAGFAISAREGFVYIRAEYPLAIKRLSHAIEECRTHGLLGANILGGEFSFDIELRLGAGAFVCGEETALIHSIEGERGQPRPRPPYPTTSGLWGKPTVINNVETFANVPAVLLYGSEWFRMIGTEKSGGTKVFALAGKIRQTGLVEVPMGTSLRDVVFGIGGGVAKGRRLKAIQTGGPAGGCIPESWIDTVVDFDTLTRAGSIMGSGGMIILDEDDCMVDVAKFFITFSQDESCGKCTPCREGTKRMLEILDRITSGKGTLDDLALLERLGTLMKKTSLCGLGKAAPNPVLSTLTHFREEYVAHVVEKRCPARRCKALIRFEIDREKCVGCTLCAKNCPVSCISGARREPHEIDQNRCIRCGRCFEVCRFGAVGRK